MEILKFLKFRSTNDRESFGQQIADEWQFQILMDEMIDIMSSGGGGGGYSGSGSGGGSGGGEATFECSKLYFYLEFLKFPNIFYIWKKCSNFTGKVH